MILSFVFDIIRIAMTSGFQRRWGSLVELPPQVSRISSTS